MTREVELDADADGEGRKEPAELNRPVGAMKAYNLNKLLSRSEIDDSKLIRK